MAVWLGRTDWNLFFHAVDNSQAVFNLAYHLHQSVTEVMGWPIELRERMLVLFDKQREFDDSKRGA